MDIFEKVANNMGPIGAHAHYSHHYFSFPKLTGELGPRMTFMGKEMLNWSLNNYLGLANHPEDRKADADATAKYGLAYPMGARMMSGNTVHHEKLEDELSAFVNKEASETIFWAPVSSINTNIGTNSLASSGEVVTPLTLTSSSLSGIEILHNNLA